MLLLLLLLHLVFEGLPRHRRQTVLVRLRQLQPDASISAAAAAAAAAGCRATTSSVPKVDQLEPLVPRRFLVLLAAGLLRLLRGIGGGGRGEGLDGLLYPLDKVLDAGGLAGLVLVRAPVAPADEADDDGAPPAGGVRLVEVVGAAAVALAGVLVPDKVVEPLRVDVPEREPAVRLRVLLVDADHRPLEHPGDAQLPVRVDRLPALVALLRVQHVQRDLPQVVVAALPDLVRARLEAEAPRLGGRLLFGLPENVVYEFIHGPMSGLTICSQFAW